MVEQGVSTVSVVTSVASAFGVGALVGALANHLLRVRTDRKQEKQERKSLLFLMLLEILSNDNTARHWARLLQEAKEQGKPPNAKPPELRIAVWEDARIRLAYLVPPEDFYVVIRYYHSVLRWKTKSEEEALGYFQTALSLRTRIVIKLMTKKYLQEEVVREYFQQYQEEEKEVLLRAYEEQRIEREGT